MEQIRVKCLNIDKNRIECSFEVSSGLSHYFASGIHIFWAEYSASLNCVPNSIAIIPFVVNVLPLVWVTNSELVMESIDKRFYDSIEKFKSGYKKMYPMLSFKGQINVERIESVEYPTSCAAAFFSGGVDAFCTLVSHLEESPSLLTVWGADVALDDKEGWKNVKAQVEETAKKFNLQSQFYIKSNFTRFLSQANLNKLVKCSGDNWWHGFQHGIGLIGLAAPLSYLEHFSIIYIASSYTDDVPHTCASDPTIDEFVEFGSTRIHHDQYEYNRQDKIRIITNFCRNRRKRLFLRVCYQVKGGKNCGRCEKCLRTIFGLLAEGVNPKDYGFDDGIENDPTLKARTQLAIKYSGMYVRCLWKDIQNRFLQTESYIGNKNINWIYSFDVYKKVSLYERMTNKFHRIMRKLLNRKLK